MHLYCVHCSAKNTYETIPNKFCGSCGNPIDRANKPVLNSSSSSKPKRKSIFADNDDDDDFEDEFSDLQLDRASLAGSVEAIVDKPRFPTFEDLAIHSAAPRGERFVRPEFKVEGGDIIQATRQECGKVQSSKEVGGN